MQCNKVVNVFEVLFSLPILPSHVSSPRVRITYGALQVFIVLYCCRLLSVPRGADGSFGFVLSGEDPVWVKSVMPGSAAQKAGITTGDAILQLNGVDVRY